MKKWSWRLVARSAMIGAVLASCSATAGAGGVASFAEVPKLSGDNEFCKGQSDGAYQHPDCRVYYQCHHWSASEVQCPDGQVFDESKNPTGDPAKSYCTVPASVARLDCDKDILRK